MRDGRACSFKTPVFISTEEEDFKRRGRLHSANTARVPRRNEREIYDLQAKLDRTDLNLAPFVPPPPPSAAFVVQVCLALRASSYPDWQIAPLLAFLSSFLSFFSLRAPSLRAPRCYLRNLDGINYTGFARLSLSANAEQWT